MTKQTITNFSPKDPDPIKTLLAALALNKSGATREWEKR